MRTKGKSPTTEMRPASASTTLTPTCVGQLTLPWSATAGSAAPSKEMTWTGKPPSCGSDTRPQRSSPTSAEVSTSEGKDLSPYWSVFTEAISSALWLPTKTDSPGSDSSLSNGWPSKTAEASWFSVTKTTAPSRNSRKIFSPSCIPSLPDCTDSAATVTQSRRIRVYPEKDQRKTLALWFDAARWCFNEAVARLTADRTLKANWKAIKTDIIHSAPDRLKAAPYQVKSVSVRDACKAVSRVKKHNAALKSDKAHGRRLEESYAQVNFRRRKDPRQGCFIPAKAVSPKGVYHSVLGKLRMAESIPEGHRDSRLTRRNGEYHLSVAYPAQRRETETQGRVVALDPGIRSFLTWFSETDAGHIGKGDFGRIQRLCAHLDNLLSKAKRCKLRWRKRNLYRAAARLRIRIGNLIDELHHQVARFLVDHFDLILLPRFETQEMAGRGKRRLRSKSVRSLLTFAHYRFQQFLLWKAWQTGKAVLLVNEAYTSKTCSWSGEIIANLGGRKTITGSDGVKVDRDINGARGIFLRALGDTPALREAAQGRIGNDATIGVC